MGLNHGKRSTSKTRSVSSAQKVARGKNRLSPSEIRPVPSAPINDTAAFNTKKTASSTARFQDGRYSTSLSEKTKASWNEHKFWFLLFIASIVVFLFVSSRFEFRAHSSTLESRDRIYTSLREAGKSNKLAVELLTLLFSDRVGVRGVYVQDAPYSLKSNLRPLTEFCGKEYVVDGVLDSVESLHHFLTLAVKQNGPKKCIVYLLDVERIAPFSPAANSLKEFLESNTLQSLWVLPSNVKALLIFASPKSKEDLKELLPHRVVHLLRFLPRDD